MGYGTKREKQSPIKVKPLPNPGESLDRELDRVYSEEADPYIVIMGMMLLMTILEWVRSFRNMPPMPVPLTVATVAICAYSIYRLAGIRKKAADLKLGRDGERAVGQCLADLQREGYRVFHDLTGDGFNIDHVIVSPHGVYVVETKTISKRTSGNPTVTFDGVRVLVDGQQMDRDPVEQALAVRAFVGNRLRDALGRSFPVRAVVVFPGWFVEPATGRKRDDIWVLNPKAVPVFIRNEPAILPPEDVARVSTAIVDYIRSRPQ